MQSLYQMGQSPPDNSLFGCIQDCHCFFEYLSNPSRCLSMCLRQCLLVFRDPLYIFLFRSACEDFRAGCNLERNLHRLRITVEKYYSNLSSSEAWQEFEATKRRERTIDESQFPVYEAARKSSSTRT